MPDVSGILVVDKPPEWTSFDVVAFVRRRSKVKRVGHAGTLDPAATGVLTLLMGTATRLTEYLVDAGKAYRGTVELGVETDTYDRDGTIVAERDASGVTRAQIEENTGWPVRFADKIAGTQPPTAKELETLRALHARTAAAHGKAA